MSDLDITQMPDGGIVVAPNQSQTLMVNTFQGIHRSIPHQGDDGTIYTITGLGNGDGIRCLIRRPYNKGMYALVHEDKVILSVGKFLELIERWSLLDSLDPFQRGMLLTSETKKNLQGHLIHLIGKDEFKNLPKTIYIEKLMTTARQESFTVKRPKYYQKPPLGY